MAPCFGAMRRSRRCSSSPAASSTTGNLREAAANLFRHLRELDHAGLDCIVAEALPEEGLGVAIMDRLRRAAHASGATITLEGTALSVPCWSVVRQWLSWSTFEEAHARASLQSDSRS